MTEQQAAELLSLMRQIAADLAAIRAATAHSIAFGMPVVKLG